MPLVTLAFAALCIVIALLSVARGMWLGLQGRTTRGLIYALTGSMTIMLDIVFLAGTSGYVNF
jgi:hypothetical protein